MVMCLNKEGITAGFKMCQRHFSQVLKVVFMVQLFGVILLLSWTPALKQVERNPETVNTELSSHAAESGQHQSSFLQSFPRVTSVNCSRLWTGDESEQQKAEYLQANRNRKTKTTAEYRKATWDCGRYLQNGGFNLSSVGEEELSFPLAFSVLVYRDADQVERLLRAIYRPHNVYCIHVDLKSDLNVRTSVELMVSCLPNVFVSPESVDARWATFTNLVPEILCMRHLWRREVRWRYFINLTGQEFPLKTNKELVQILKAYHGANDIGGIRDPQIFRWRWERFLPAPFNLTVFKGSVHLAASRGFVDYVLHTGVPQALLEWERPVSHPDESYFSTLNNNPHLGVPGSATSNHTSNQHASHFNRFEIWDHDQWRVGRCQGQFVRAVCRFGVGDLPVLTTAPELFANKFSYDYQPLSYDCLEEWYFHKIGLEENGTSPPVNVSLYEQTPFVRYRYSRPDGQL